MKKNTLYVVRTVSGDVITAVELITSTVRNIKQASW
jgi:hypothetical protein